MNSLLAVLPKLSEHLQIAQLCKDVSLTIEAIKKLFNGGTILFIGKLHSPEHDQDFSM